MLNAYRQIFPARTNPIEPPWRRRPISRWAAWTSRRACEEEFNAWYNTVYIPGYLAVPGCLRARRFVVVDGQPKYLTVYEFEHAEVPESGPGTACATQPWSTAIRPHLQLDGGSPAVYRRITPK